MSYHAQRSPSGAFRWTDCTAAINAEYGLPSVTSEASRPGTCAHQLSAELLLHNTDPKSYLGRVMAWPTDGSREDWGDQFVIGTQFAHTVTVDQEMIDACVAYVGFVRHYRETVNGTLLVEQQVSIEHITGEAGASGTSDGVVISDGLMTVIDAKFGRGRVNAYDVMTPAGVDPLTGEAIPPVVRMNLQLAMYLLASLEQYGLLGDFKRVKGIIVQPYLNHVSEYECSVDELLALGEWIKGKAEETRTNPQYRPSAKACFFCKARFDCDARRELALSSALEGFDEVTCQPTAKTPLPADLGRLWGLLDFIRDWANDIEKRAFEVVQGGGVVLGPDGQPLKLVEGRKGHKAWADEAAVEAMVASWRLTGDPMHVTKLITPTDAAKLAKAKKGDPEGVIGKTRWSRLQPLITQPDGKPTLALGSDHRPALGTQAGMQDVPPADNSDLF